jgi:phytoene synthase
MKDDYYQKAIKTDEDLEHYAFKTMGNFIKMLLPVLAQKTFKENPKALRKATASLAHALSITTMLRNVRDDLIDRRLYFPTDTMEQNKVKIKTLRTGIVTPEYRSMVEQYIDKALEEFETFYDTLEYFDKDIIAPVYTALKFYEGLLREIRKNDYNNITKRHKLSKFRKWLLKRSIQNDLKKRGLN